MATENGRKRRHYRVELKAQILAECDEPGASVAKVAMAHGINANIVHGWRKLRREAGAVTVSEQFVPVAVAPVAPRSTPAAASAVEGTRAATSAATMRRVGRAGGRRGSLGAAISALLRFQLREPVGVEYPRRIRGVVAQGQPGGVVQ